MTNSTFKTLRVFAITLLLLGCAQTALAAWTLSGTIYGGGNPSPGASVSLTDANTLENLGSTTTNVNGTYSFTVSDGTYTLMINVNGFDESVVTGIIVSGADVVQDATVAFLRVLDDRSRRSLAGVVSRLRKRLVRSLAAEGIDRPAVHLSLDLRY